MTVKTTDQAKAVFKTIARAHGFERAELCRRGELFNICSLKFFRSKEWIDSYMEECNAIGADLPDRKCVEDGCTMCIAVPTQFGDVHTDDLCGICKDTVEDDAVWLMLWDYFLHAAKSTDIYLEDHLTSRVLVARGGSTEERILMELDLAGLKVELDT